MKQKAEPSLRRLEEIPDKEYALGTLFVIANRLQTLLDREFESCGLTTKQWFLSIIIGGAFDEPPTLSEAAAVMGSTHQNVKQVALKLKDKGLLEFIQDPDDRRVMRLQLTERSNELWMGMQERSEGFMEELYKGLGSGGLAELRILLGRLMASIEEMNEKQQREFKK